MSLDFAQEGSSFHWAPTPRFWLRWEIWENGSRVAFQSWSPYAVLSFSRERLKYGDNAEIMIRKMDLVDWTEQAMLKVLNKDLASLEYHHLISSKGNLFVGLRLHTNQGVWNCCVDGTVFRDEDVVQ